jgi:hypothetical protein
VNYSICRDASEDGAVSQGFSNLWRIQEAERYANAGVNTTLTLTCDVTSSIKENTKRGFTVEEVLQSQRRGMTIRLLPLRINSKKFCYEATEKKWGEIIKPANNQYFLNLGFEWRYIKKGSNEAIPLFFNDDFQKLVNENTGVCGRVGEVEYCDLCNLQEGARIFFPISKLVQVKKYVDKLTYKRYSKKKEIETLRTLELFD